MGDTVVQVEDLSKQYRLGLVSSKSLGDDVKSWVNRITGKEDHRLSKGEENVRDQVGESKYVWSLRDINFEVNRGEVLGIIGKNGAGKSTLLKILSKITAPTTGVVRTKGRIASLLEVGTGFHPELSGKENIYLNGAILGMNKAEITRKLDEIIDFSGVERFIDTPVKRYSSGMYVRLAFGIAAHLEPEILIVDEVLAVGDVEFQNKCIGRMKKVSEEGRTVIMVSHNMQSVRALCERGILLENGKIAASGDVDSIVSAYIKSNVLSGEQTRIGEQDIERIQEGHILTTNPTIRVRQVALHDAMGTEKNTFLSDEDIFVSVNVKTFTKITDLRIIVELVDEFDSKIVGSQFQDSDKFKEWQVEGGVDAGDYEFTCKIDRNLLSEQRYYVNVQVINIKNEHIHLPRVLTFTSSFVGYNNITDGGLNQSFLRPKFDWNYKK